jgi:presenilin-like A22 family membrane protease
VNLISLINTSGNRIKLILTGMVQVVTFFFSFFIFVPLFQTTGAAISILIACVGSSLFLILLTEHRSFRYILSTVLSVLAGYTIGKLTGLVIGNDPQFLIVFASVVATLISMYGTKNISMAETNFFLRGLLQRK